MNRGRRGEEIFFDKKDYGQFIEIIKETGGMWKFRIAAYCLLPKHYHLLVQTPDGNLSRCMRHVDGVYTQRFNRFHHCDGPLFRGRYKSILVDADNYLLPLVRYIHQNPLKAGLAKELAGYEWSSHKGYLSSSEKWSWLHKEYILSMFSEDRRDQLGLYRKFVSKEDEEKILGIIEGKKWPSVLGSERFINWVKGRFYPRKLDDEVPQSKELSPKVDRILKAVSDFYGIGEGDLIRSRRGVFNEPRNVAIYLIRLLRGDSLRQIGEHFQMEKYSSVSSVIERVKAEIAQDRGLRERKERLIALVTKSQEQT